ncbi:hypothetical protein PR048_002412 [Dryococelus australis]|uniref:Ig-like domain-containing protein n=1 Tax=Dryococelus australis TaxID=614101 RepID=A0ABQ9IL65_9NEOP|nr:hypothetical protein PR048_002412 [Dryococelus australis]
MAPERLGEEPYITSLRHQAHMWYLPTLARVQVLIDRYLGRLSQLKSLAAMEIKQNETEVANGMQLWERRENPRENLSAKATCKYFSMIPSTLVLLAAEVRCLLCRQIHNSSDSQVVLKSVNLSSTGRYLCEVSAEAPSFETVSEHGDMVVVECTEGQFSFSFGMGSSSGRCSQHNDCHSTEVRSVGDSNCTRHISLNPLPPPFTRLHLCSKRQFVSKSCSPPSSPMQSWFLEACSVQAHTPLLFTPTPEHIFMLAGELPGPSTTPSLSIEGHEPHPLPFSTTPDGVFCPTTTSVTLHLTGTPQHTNYESTPEPLTTPTRLPVHRLLPRRIKTHLPLLIPTDTRTSRKDFPHKLRCRISCVQLPFGHWKYFFVRRRPGNDNPYDIRTPCSNHINVLWHRLCSEDDKGPRWFSGQTTLLPSRRTVFVSWRAHSHFHMWVSCRTMALLGWFSRRFPVSPTTVFRRCSIDTSFHPHLQTSMNLYAETYRFPATNKTPPHHMLASPTSATYRTLFKFCAHLQEGLDVTTSDVYTNTVPTYHVLVHTITKTWKFKIRRSRNPRQQVLLRFKRGLVNNALHVATRRVHTCGHRPQRHRGGAAATCALLHMSQAPRGTLLRHRSVSCNLRGRAVLRRRRSYVCTDTYKPSPRGTLLRRRSGAVRALSARRVHTCGQWPRGATAALQKRSTRAWLICISARVAAAPPRSMSACMHTALRRTPDSSFSPSFEAEKRGSDKGDTTTRIKCAIATKRKALNWRAVFSSQCVYLWNFQRRPYNFIDGKCVRRFSAGCRLRGFESEHRVYIAVHSPSRALFSELGQQRGLSVTSRVSERVLPRRIGTRPEASAQKTVAPFKFRAGLEIEMKFISNRRNWRFEISIRDQHACQTTATNARFPIGRPCPYRPRRAVSTHRHQTAAHAAPIDQPATTSPTPYHPNTDHQAENVPATNPRLNVNTVRGESSLVRGAFKAKERKNLFQNREDQLQQMLTRNEVRLGLLNASEGKNKGKEESATKIDYTQGRSPYCASSDTLPHYVCAFRPDSLTGHTNKTPCVISHHVLPTDIIRNTDASHLAQAAITNRWGRGGLVARLLTSHLGEPGLIPGGSLPDFRMPLVGRFSRGSPISLYLPRFTRISS